ncbi:hypothetical protein GJ496_002498 [Pomphorhynchus laevis]|nr:hypothetical protein GJ496_002498 [Pomphorhynchus laevis]
MYTPPSTSEISYCDDVSQMSDYSSYSEISFDEFDKYTMDGDDSNSMYSTENSEISYCSFESVELIFKENEKVGNKKLNKFSSLRHPFVPRYHSKINVNDSNEISENLQKLLNEPFPSYISSVSSNKERDQKQDYSVIEKIQCHQRLDDKLK